MRLLGIDLQVWGRVPRKKTLLFLVPCAALIIGLMVLSVLWAANAFFSPKVAMWTTHVRTLDPASDPADPKWLKYEVKEPSATGKRGNTLRYSLLSGISTKGIDLSGIAVQKGASPQTEIVTVKGSANAYLRVCDLSIMNYDGTEFEITNSKIRLLKFNGTIEVEGESINITKADVPAFACEGPGDWGQLPQDKFSGTVSEVIIEVTGAGTADAKADFIKLTGFRVPGRTLFNKLKPKTLLIEDASFGDGDGDFSAKDFVVNENNEVRESNGKVKGDAKIDNR